ncbi:MAG: hypothetical protein LBU39_03065 [Desulfobulbaceae bacterium]|jgi:hypothetical protein|nr:hypothetical protein [Desulfobulbaceae bacterium]
MGNVISIFEQNIKRTCFAAYRRCLDHERDSLLEYDDCLRQLMDKPGETTRYDSPRNIASIAANWRQQEPTFKLFLDGSRRTYKIADLPIGTQVFPIIAGQIGVGVCKRESRRLAACEFSLHAVLALPDKVDADGKSAKQHRAFCADLAGKLNAGQDRVHLDALLFYPTPADENFEDKGVARIQEYMVEREKAMVEQLVHRHLINDRSWLIKDGSLEYNRIADKDDPFTFSRIRSNYKRVVGVSKSFNPELAKLKNNRSAAGMIASLKPYERTPAAKYQTDRVDGKFAVWYVRLREPRQSQGPFDGIVKCEKILVTQEEEENGLDSHEVDNISAWLVNERNPVCYGKDKRWANHLYPVYLTETFIKSKYRGAAHFVNLF